MVEASMFGQMGVFIRAITVMAKEKEKGMKVSLDCDSLLRLYIGHSSFCSFLFQHRNLALRSQIRRRISRGSTKWCVLCFALSGVLKITLLTI
jgi:hypothetical protein